MWVFYRGGMNHKSNLSTPPSRPRRITMVVVGLALALLAAACGGSSDTANTSGSGGSGSSSSEGSFLISGSSTVFPIVQLQAERYEGIEPGVAIAVEGPGSGDGARKFCAGEVPITNSSRQLKDEEIEICDAAGISFVELKRGIDGISVITSADNDAIECVSFNDLYALLSDEAIGFSSWADANELTASWGGQQFPDAELDVFGPGRNPAPSTPSPRSSSKGSPRARPASTKPAASSSKLSVPTTRRVPTTM